MREVNGWFMPSDDFYFDRWIEGAPTKSNGFQREHLLEAFKHVRNWDIAVDVGAHVGFWAKDMAEKFGKVYCFEPHPKTFACLAKNMAEYENVMLSCMALGMREGHCDIVRGDPRTHNSGSEYIVPKTTGSIRITSLDDVGVQGCDLLKIDVEGYEYAVLKGARKTITKYRPVIIMETDKPFSQRRFGWNRQRPIEYIQRKFNYTEVAHMRPDRVFVPVDV